MALYTRNQSVSVSGTSTEVLPSVPPGLKRKAFHIINTSAAAVITVVYGNVPAVSKAGDVLQPGGYVSEDTNINFECWNDSIQVITDGAAGTVAVVERLEDNARLF